MNIIKGFINFLPDFGPGQNNFPGHKDEENDAGLHHPVNQTGKQLWLVGAELTVGQHQALKSDGEPHVARSDHILDFKVFKLGRKPKFLHNSGVFSRSKSGVFLRLCSGAHHLAGAENERRRTRFSNPHDHGRETLRIELCVTSVQRDPF